MKFTFSGMVTVSLYTEVEADSLQEALEIAEQRGIQGLCHQCSGRDHDTQWSLTGELDGEVVEIRED